MEMHQSTIMKTKSVQIASPPSYRHHQNLSNMNFILFRQESIYVYPCALQISKRASSNKQNIGQVHYNEMLFDLRCATSLFFLFLVCWFVLFVCSFVCCCTWKTYASIAQIYFRSQCVSVAVT